MRWGQRKGFVERCAIWHQVLRQANAFAVLRVVHAAGQHHVRHTRRANQARDAHGAATADKNTTGAFWQRVERGLIGHADVAGACQLQPAANHCAVQRGNYRHRAELHAL